MASYTAEQAKRFALERKQRNTQFSQPQQAQQGRRGFEASSLIQEGGALGGAIGGATLGASLGSVVPGIGTAIGGLLGAGIGGFTGSLGGGLTESKVRDNKFDLGGNLKEAAVDGVLSAGPLKLIKGGATAAKAARGGATLASALRSGGDDAAKFTLRGIAGRSATQKSKDLAIRPLGLAKGSKNRIIQKTGQNVTDIANSKGISSYDDIVKNIDLENQSYGRILDGITNVNKSDIVKQFDSTYKTLLNAKSTAGKAKAKAFKAEADNILDQIGKNAEVQPIATTPELNGLNPTGGLLVEYNPKARATAPLGKNMVSLNKTTGGSPDDIITIYRGAPKNQKDIVAGDFITDMPELAKSYTGDGNVISMKVRKGDVLDDITEGGGNEYIYRPQSKAPVKQFDNIDGRSLNIIKREFDDLVTEAGQFADQAQQTVNKKVADSLRKGIQEASGSDELKKVGVSLRNLKLLEKEAAKNLQQGTGRSGLRASDLIAGGPASLAGGPIAGLAAAAGIRAASSPTAARAGSAAARQLGTSLESSAARASAAGGATRNLALGGALGAGVQSSQSVNNNMINPTENDAINQSINTDISDPSIPQEQPQSNAIDVQGIALQLINKGASMEEVQQVIEELTTINAIQDGSFFQPEEEDQELTAAQATRAASAQNALNDIPIIEQAIADGSLGGAKALPGATSQIGRRLLGTENLDAALFNIADNILRARSGAATPEPEVKRFMEGFLPSPLDSEQAKRQKLQRAVAELRSYTNPQGAAAGTLQEALSQGGFQ